MTSLPAFKLAMIGFLASTAALTACNSTGCIDNQSALPLAKFYDYETLTAKTLQAVEIGAVGAPDDSLMVDNNAVTSSYLPFNIGENVTTYFFRYTAYGLDDPAMFDTIRFDYERIPYYASEDCGVMFKYNVTNVDCTYHRIDSISLLTPVITNLDQTSLEIYFSDLTPLEKPVIPDEPQDPDNPDNPLTPDDLDETED